MRSGISFATMGENWKEPYETNDKDGKFNGTFWESFEDLDKVSRVQKFKKKSQKEKKKKFFPPFREEENQSF